MMLIMELHTNLYNSVYKMVLCLLLLLSFFLLFRLSVVVARLCHPVSCYVQVVFPLALLAFEKQNNAN